MRLLLCLNNDFLANYALNLLWEPLRKHEVSIALSQGIGPPSTKRAAMFDAWGKRERQLVSEGLFPWCEQQPHTARFCTFGQFAARLGGESRVFSSINSPEALAYIQATKPDLIFALRFGHIMKPPIFGIPRHGVINLHSGLLPQYRGIYAPFWAMLNGERDIGCSLHYVPDAGIDTGDVIAEYRLQTEYKHSVMWNIAALYRGIAPMVQQALEDIERMGHVPSVPQSAEGVGYYPFPQDEHVAAFERQGGKFYSEEDYETLFEAYGMDVACLKMTA